MGSIERVHRSALPTAFALRTAREVKVASQKETSEEAPMQCRGAAGDKGEMCALCRGLVKTTVLEDSPQFTAEK